MRTILKPVIVFMLGCGTWQLVYSQKRRAISAETQQHIRDVEADLTPSVIVKYDPHPRHSLSERMTALHVPGVSVAVIHHGAIEWAQGFGVMNLDGSPVTGRDFVSGGIDQQAF